MPVWARSIEGNRTICGRAARSRRSAHDTLLHYVSLARSRGSRTRFAVAYRTRDGRFGSSWRVAGEWPSARTVTVRSCTPTGVGSPKDHSGRDREAVDIARLRARARAAGARCRRSTNEDPLSLARYCLAGFAHERRRRRGSDHPHTRARRGARRDHGCVAPRERVDAERQPIAAGEMVRAVAIHDGEHDYVVGHI